MYDGPTYYVKFKTGPKWRGLTPEQHSAWFEFAMDHPITYWNGNIKTLNGWQIFNYVNCQLATAAYNFLICDPPNDLTVPDNIELQFCRWIIKSKLASGDTRRHGRLIANVETAIPEDRVIIFWQTWERGRKPNYIPPLYALIQTRNQQKYRAGVMLPGFTGAYDLASYGGMPLARGRSTDNIQGNWARCNPNRPMGVYRVVSTINGMYTQFPITL